MSPLPIVRSTRRALAGALLLGALAASGLPHAPHAAVHAAVARMAPRTIIINATHPTFPASIRAGLLALRVIGADRESFDVGVARPNPGVSMAQAAAAGQDFMRLTRLVTFIGGLGVPAGGAGTVVLDLRTPGHYGMHIAHGDGDPGRVLAFSVTPGSAQAGRPPRATVSVTLQGTRFAGLPNTLPTGVTTFKVTGGGPGVRDMLLYRLDPGKTVQDMIRAARIDEQTGKDPTWAHAAGNMDVLSPHQVAWMTLTLTPGHYVALCPLPDPQHRGQALMFEGMIVPFTVS